MPMIKLLEMTIRAPEKTPFDLLSNFLTDLQLLAIQTGVNLFRYT
jgi:hypothetical protein